MIRKASRDVLPHGGKIIDKTLAVIFAVVPEIIECALSRLAPEIAAAQTSRLFWIVLVGYSRPIGCSVSVAARRIEILMHIKEYIDTVSGAEIEDAVHIVEILVIVAARLGLDHAQVVPRRIRLSPREVISSSSLSSILKPNLLSSLFLRLSTILTP